MMLDVWIYSHGMLKVKKKAVEHSWRRIEKKKVTTRRIDVDFTLNNISSLSQAATLQSTPVNLKRVAESEHWSPFCDSLTCSAD